MARYKDCNKCYHRLVCAGDTDKWNYFGECPHYINSADVVPKSEVESIFDELIKQAGEIAENYKKEADGMSVSEFARIEYRGTQIGALLVQYKIAELKKKYTEGNQ